METLSQMLEDYLNGKREFPSYEELQALTTKQLTVIEYNSSMGEAATIYLESKAYGGKVNLPATMRWSELFKVMVDAAAPVQAQEPVCHDCEGRGFNYGESVYGGDGFMQPPDPPMQERCEVCEGSGIAPPDSEVIVPDGVKQDGIEAAELQTLLITEFVCYRPTHPAGLMAWAKIALLNCSPHRAAGAAQGDALNAKRYKYLRSDDEGIEFRDKATGKWRSDCPSGETLDFIVGRTIAAKEPSC